MSQSNPQSLQIFFTAGVFINPAVRCGLANDFSGVFFHLLQFYRKHCFLIENLISLALSIAYVSGMMGAWKLSMSQSWMKVATPVLQKITEEKPIALVF